MKTAILLSALTLATSAHALHYTPNSPTGPTPFTISGAFKVSVGGVVQSCPATLLGNITANGKALKINHLTSACISSASLPWTCTPTGSTPNTGTCTVSLIYNGVPIGPSTVTLYTEDKGSPGQVLTSQIGVATAWAAFNGISSPVIGVVP